MSKQNGSEVKTTTAAKLKVFIVDDHPIIRRGLTDLINQEPDMEVCGEAAEVPDALRRIKVACPQIAIIDLSLQGGHGIELIEQVKLMGIGVKMIVFSMHDESLFAERVLRAGALGFINKHEPAERLLQGIREVMEGRICLSPAMAGRLLHSVIGGQPLDHNPIHSLSNRELQVFEMIGEGLPTKKIAVKLHLSRKTVEAHREKIKNKLSLGNSAELARRAIQWVLENQ